MSSVIKIYALFLGSALLMFGGGLQGLLLSVRGAEEGFSLLALGLIGTGWSVGFVAGSITVPMVVRKVGHIRAFSVMAAIGTVTILLNLMLINDVSWILLRALVRLLLCRRRDDRRKLAQRSGREQEPRHHLLDLCDHQHGLLDAWADRHVGHRRHRLCALRHRRHQLHLRACCRRH